MYNYKRQYIYDMLTNTDDRLRGFKNTIRKSSKKISIMQIFCDLLELNFL